MELLSTGSNLLLIVLGFGLLIAVHEAGHFLAAKWAGIRVHVFAIGMGPVLVSWRRGVGARLGSTEPVVAARFGKPASLMSDSELTQHGIGETEYSLRLLPLGGFVGMLGQDDLDPAATSADPRSYQRTPVGKRMVVISAGVVMNLVLAIGLFMVAFLAGVRFEAPVVGAAGANPGGLRPGDRIVSINGSPTRTFADIQIAAAMSRPGTSLSMEVARPGTPELLEITATPQVRPGVGLRTLDVAPASDTTLLADRESVRTVQELLERTGLASHGVGPGWTLVKAGDRPVVVAEDLRAAAAASGGNPIPTEWRSPDGRLVTAPLPVDPELQWMTTPARADGVKMAHRGLLGLSPLARVERVMPRAPAHGILHDGDVLLRVGDMDGPRPGDVAGLAAPRAGETLSLRVLRGGRTLDLVTPVGSDGLIGIQLGYAEGVPLLAECIDAVAVSGRGTETSAPTPAAALELPALTRVERVADRPVSNWREIREALRAALAGGGAFPRQVELQVALPDGGSRTVSLRVEEADAAAVAALAWSASLPPGAFEPLMVTLSADGNPLRAVAMGFQQTGRLVQLTYLTIDRLVRGSVAVKELRGPVGIVHAGTTVADRGLMYVVFFLAMISVNLAVLNFLPLPIVDGGMFLYLVYEKLTGRPPPPRVQGAATLAGLCLLACLFLLTFYNDVMRLVGAG